MAQKFFEADAEVASSRYELGRIHSIESMGTVDGPGIRFVVFTQGCPMRCAYCHNPDTWAVNAGSMVSVEKLLEEFESNRQFYKSGGITVTGGEPLLQPKFLADLFRAAHEAPRGRIHTCLDSCGYAYDERHPERFDAALSETDMVLLDIKHSDPTGHRELTGCNPERIIAFGDELARRGIKTAIHEQNAFPGVTNKLLAREVNIVLAASADAVEKLGAPDKTTVVGNPVRPEVLTADRAAARAKLNAGDRTVILSFGGSLGADRINQVVADLCAWEKQTDRNTLHLHATGSRGVKLFEDLENEKGFAPGENLIVTEYINNMPQLLAAADLVIARSGALTLAELEAVGRASVLIPSPNVAENHQYYNALELQKAGAAVVIEEKNLTGEGLVKTVEELLNTPGKLAEMGANAKTLGNPHSLDLITEKLMELMKN